MSNFGALTDHFALASATLILVNSSETPIEQSRADAQDENGDIVASSYFGNTTQAMAEISCTYALRSGTLDIATIKLGALAASATVLRESIEVATSNSEFPQVTVTGRKNIIAITAPTGKLNTFTLPTLTLTGIKQAQLIGFTVGTGCRLTSSSIAANLELAQQDNGLGEPIAHGISGGTGTITAEFVRVTTAPSWTVASGAPWAAAGLTQTQAPSLEQGQAAYHTTTASAQFTVTRDAA
jgi:hypothetical protein